MQGVEYDFSEDLDGDKLMNNLSWLGRGGDIMDLAVRQQEEDNDDDDDEESSYPRKKKRKSLIIDGGGVAVGDDEGFLSERSLRRALPEISQTLRNWTMHGQNLGHMVDEYKRKSRTMPVKDQLRIGNFFNMASSVLDTIGSMTENTILNSVQFVKGGLMGDSSIERTGTDMSNPPPIQLAPTPLNMTHYSARYEDRSSDRNVIIPGQTYNQLMYSGDFPVYPTGVQLRHNPNKENVDFAYDSDAGNTSEDDQSENDNLRDSSGEGTASDSNGSYV